MLDRLFPILTGPVLRACERMPAELRRVAEELRVRAERPLEVVAAGKPWFVSADGTAEPHPSGAYRPTREDCDRLMECITRHSLYSFEEQLRRGFITVAGGHRVGLAGRAVVENGRIRLLRDVAGLNFRIAREVIGAAEPVLPRLIDLASESIYHTLVLSPPQGGKTTFVRDLARLVSYGRWPPGMSLGKGLKVGIVDERSEIAACDKGVPTFDVGPRTDVLDGCPKAEGMLMMVRSLSPDVLVVDEIGGAEDAGAVEEAAHAGVRVVATAHAWGVVDAEKRPGLARLIAGRTFGRYVVLQKGRTAGAGDRAIVLDADFRPVNRMSTFPVATAGVLLGAAATGNESGGKEA